jgi:hypothetical protein
MTVYGSLRTQPLGTLMSLMDRSVTDILSSAPLQDLARLDA